MNLLPWVLLLSLLAPATPVLAKTMDPCQGPEFNYDLAPEMPPVDDQGQSPWCATFTAKALVDHEIHMQCLQSHASDQDAAQECAYDPESRVSPADLNSLDLANKAGWGTKIQTVDGSNVSNILDGAQHRGQILSEKQLPFDQAFFGTSHDQETRLTQLAQLYTTARTDIQNNSCSFEQDDSFQRLLSIYPDLEEILTRSKTQDNFLDTLANQYEPIPQNLTGSLKPLFDTEDTFLANPVQEHRYFIEKLKKQEPIAISVCIGTLAKVEDIPGIDTSSDGSCDPHGMTIIGFRKQSGKCEVHLRNSWGENWPWDRNGDGNIWVSAANLSRNFMPASDGSAEFVTIHPRQTGAPIQNKITTLHYRFTGTTTLDGPENGEIIQKGVRKKGTFNSNDQGISLKRGELDITFPPKKILIGNFDKNENLVCGVFVLHGENWCVNHSKATHRAPSRDPRACGCK